LGPVLDPVETAEQAPSAADVAIIGGGVIGLSAALFLARQGVSVVVCEKGRFATSG
jgi:glycine/D-amino acid oxidase-like deaminating enzyme